MVCRWLVALVAVLAGCDLVFPIEEPESTCYGTGFAAVCIAGTPPPLLELSRLETIDTGQSAECLPVVSGPAACVIGGDDVNVRNLGILNAIGPKPLVIIGERIIVEGKLDVSSGRVTEPGAGAAAAATCAGTTEPTMGSANAGGGFGGSFGSSGGIGGADTAQAGGRPGELGSGGAELRGGCPGGTGAGIGSDDPGGGGSSGGVIVLLARELIDVKNSGLINASGAGGRGGTTGGGGGGGGSGGMIVLDASVISIAGQVFANGGGGGGGAVVSGLDGVAGENGRAPDVAAMGGGNGERGGDGAFGMQPAGDAADMGGGGGGGGLGVIFTFPDLLVFPVAKVSPAPSQP